MADWELGFQTQIRQLGGMRGLMAKPQAILLNSQLDLTFKEGLSI